MKIIKVSEHPQFIKGSLENNLIRSVSKFDICESSAGIVVVCKIYSSNIDVSYIAENNVFCKANYGTCLMKGIVYIVRDLNGKILKKGNFSNKNLVIEEKRTIFHSQNKCYVMCELYLPSIIRLKEVYFYIDEDGNFDDIMLSNKDSIFFLGGENTLGAGCTFQTSTLSYIIGTSLNCEVYNLGDVNNHIYNNHFIDIIERIQPSIVVSELWAPSTDIEYMNNNIYGFVESLGSVLLNRGIIIFWEFPFISSNNMYEKHKLYLRVKQKLSEKRNIYFVNSENCFAGVDKDKFTISVNFMNDYGNYILGKYICDLVKVLREV